MYTKTDLAQYNRGKQLPDLLVNNIDTSINSVLLPAMSQVQDNPERVKNMTRRAMKTSTYVIAPVMMGLAFTAESVIHLILTEKWLPCVPFLRIFCITYMFYPVNTTNLNAIKAMGRSDLFLKLETIKKVIGLIVLLGTMWFGVMAMAYSLLFTSITSQIINSWPNKKLLDYSYPEQIRDILPGILLAVFMGCCVYPVKWIGFSDLLTLFIQVVMGACVYIGGSALLKLEGFRYLWEQLKPVWRKIGKKEESK